jgi:hypothetical protein
MRCKWACRLQPSGCSELVAPSRPGFDSPRARFFLKKSPSPLWEICGLLTVTAKYTAAGASWQSVARPGSWGVFLWTTYFVLVQHPPGEVFSQSKSFLCICYVSRNEKISLQLFPPNQSQILDGSIDRRLLKGECPTSRPWACTQPIIYQIELRKRSVESVVSQLGLTLEG